jgi:AcrR family transcriptional regulator
MLRAATDLVCARLQDTSDEALSAALAHVQLTEVAARATQIVRSELQADTWDHAVAGITTGAIYQVWPSQAEFQADLMFHIAELDATFEPIIDEVRQIAASGIAAGDPLGRTLAAMVGTSFEHTRSSPVFYVSLCFYLHSGNERVRQVLRHGQRSFVEAIRPVWQALLDGYGLRMRDPYTVDDLAAVIGIVIEGFALQWVRDPNSIDPAGLEMPLPCRTAQILFDQMTTPA